MSEEQSPCIKSLNLSSKGLNDQNNIFTDIIQSFPDLLELDISNNNLTVLPNDLSFLSKLSSLDIRSNPFNNFENIVQSLSTLPSLVDLKINLADENQVKLILSKLQNLELLNGKSTKEDNQLQLNLVDLMDDEIKNISLQNEIPSFNEIYKKVSEKLKTQGTKDNFKEEFQSLIKSEINKINSNYETVPNYIYATNVLESQLVLYSFFNEKFISGFLEKNDEEIGKLEKIIHDNITKSYLLLIEIIYKLYPKICEKTTSLKYQLDEAVKLNHNNELNEDKNIHSEKEKDIIIAQLKEENNILKNKINQLTNENKIMTEKMMQNAKLIINNNINQSNNNYLNDNKNNVNMNNPNSNNMSLMRKNSKDKLGKINNFNNNMNNQGKFPNNNMNNISYWNSNNNMYVQSGPLCTRVFTIKMMKETINDIYNSKTEFDKKSNENKLPRETLEQHMYTYLNQKYGLKSIIIEWASNIINGIKLFSNEDSEILLFGKILRNEIEEESRFVYGKLKQSVIDVLTYFLKIKYPLKSIEEITKMKTQKESGFLIEDEWKKIINYLYESTDSKFLENKIFDFIQKKYFKNNLNSPEKKLSRENIINISKIKDEFNISFKDFIKILHEFQIKTREKYLRNFVILFKKIDLDNNGIIDEEEFISLINSFNIFGDKINENLLNLLNIVDPNNNKQITFSECVNLLSNQPYIDEQGNINGSILDKICLDESNNTNMNNNFNNNTPNDLK